MVVVGVEESSSLGPKDHSFFFLLQKVTILGCVGKGKLNLSLKSLFHVLNHDFLAAKVCVFFFFVEH